MISSRERKILEYLIQQESLVTIKELTSFCGASERSVRNDLKNLNKWLAEKGLPPIEILKRKGVYLDPEAKAVLTDVEITKEQDSYYFSAQDRKYIILGSLFFKDKIVNSTKLPDLLNVSQSTIVNDMRQVYKWLKSNDISVESKAHIGISLNDSEENIRKGCFLLLCEMAYPSFNSILTSGLSYLETVFSRYNLEEPKAFLDKYRLPLLEIIDTIQKEHNYQLTDDGLLDVFLMMLIVTIRIKKNCFISSSSEINRHYERLYSGHDAIDFSAFYKMVKLNSFNENENRYLNIVWHIGNRYVQKKDKPIVSNNEVQVFLQGLETALGYHIDWRKEEVMNIAKDLDIFISKRLLNIKTYYEEEVKYDVSRWQRENDVCRKQLTAFLEEKCGQTYEATKYETNQMLIELASCIARHEQETAKSTYKIFVVCSGTLDESRLINYRLNQLFSNISKVEFISYNEYKKARNFLEYDVLLSTVDLPEDAGSYFKISSLVTKEELLDLVLKLRSRLLIVEQRRIVNEMVDVVMGMPEIRSEQKAMLSMEVAKYLYNKDYYSFKSTLRLSELISPRLIKVKASVSSGDEAIQKAGELLMNRGLIQQDEIDAMIELNKKLRGYTVIDEGVAFPHLLTDNVDSPCVCLMTLKKPIPMTEGGRAVSLIIMLVSNDDVSHISIIEDIIELLNNKDKKQKIMEARKTEDIITVLND
ncbi:MAG: PTS sugar transporter subunit IIA [Erysipelotrichaceae bacterium]|nr:PTS sugar transporter subunit IIA [Erysipelotrichaceae bacterium]